MPNEPTKYCYHCMCYHPVTEMRLVESKSGKRWRCIKSIVAAKRPRADRESFGREISRINSAEAAARQRASKIDRVR